MKTAPFIALFDFGAGARIRSQWTEHKTAAGAIRSSKRGAPFNRKVKGEAYRRNPFGDYRHNQMPHFGPDSPFECWEQLG